MVVHPIDEYGRRLEVERLIRPTAEVASTPAAAPTPAGGGTHRQMA